MSISRTNALRTGAALAALVATLALAACGGGGIEGGSSSSTANETVKTEGKPSGELTISQWPLYIDKKTVGDFEDATGVKVKYVEDINSNEEFFNKMQPLLSRGESGGRSMLVVTDYALEKMRSLGYLQNLDWSALPNVEKNLSPSLRNPPTDPKGEFTVPWQSGMTGIVVNTKEAPDLHSACELFDPQYKGKVDFYNEAQQTVALLLKCEGVDLDTATEADWMRTIEKIKKASESGQIRRFTGNDYTSDLTNGNIVAAIGFSGDAFQLQADNPNLEWRMPTEGCILWSDDMVIPIGAPNPTAAEAFMNYVYEPAHMAQIEAYVNYVTPVDGVKQVLAKTNPSLADNQLIFPSAQFTKNCSNTPRLDTAEEQNIVRAYDAVLNG